MTSRRFPLIPLIPVLLLAGCKGQRTPEEAYRSFAGALALRDAEKAFSMLSHPSQEAVRRLAEEASKESGGAVPPDPKRMLVSGDPAAKAIKSLKVEREAGGEAVLSVDDGSGARPVKMVRERFRWKVSLEP
jgi:hypothetical protein